MNCPETLRYSKSHEWVKKEGRYHFDRSYRLCTERAW